MRNSLTELSEGRTPVSPPPIEQQDELNDAELAHGIGTPLSDAAARADHLLGEIIELYRRVGDQPFEWYRWKNTTDAVLGNSYTHPRLHMYEYWCENGERERANKLLEDAVPEMKEASSSPIVHGTAIFNLACVRSNQGRAAEAIELLGYALELRPDLKEQATKDADLEPLRGDPHFQELVKS
jgi:tetratricopeptide (TPR) repeat protein